MGTCRLGTHAAREEGRAAIRPPRLSAILNVMERLEAIAAIGGDDQQQRYRQAQAIVDAVLALTKEPMPVQCDVTMGNPIGQMWRCHLMRGHVGRHEAERVLGSVPELCPTCDGYRLPEHVCPHTRDTR